MDKTLENQLRQMVKPYLNRGRPGDYEHTLRTIRYARQLLQHEEGDSDIVIPTLYLHDIGWSQINYEDFISAPLVSQKENAISVDQHMKLGAALAKPILERLGFDLQMTRAIVSIIAIHDRPEKIFAMKNPSATIVFEADYLDKYGPDSLLRFDAMFATMPMTESHKKDAIAHLREGLKQWFRTPTAKSMAVNLARESGLF